MNTFEMKSIEQKLEIFYCNPTGEYTHTAVEIIPAGFGLPQYATIVQRPEPVEGMKEYFLNGKWLQTEYFIGRVYFVGEGTPMNITEPDVYPEDALFVLPSEDKEGCVQVIVDGKWTYCECHIGEVIFDKVTYDGVMVEELGPIPSTHTSKEPIEFGVFDENADDWVKSVELETEFLSSVERSWRDSELRPVVDRIQQYQSNLSMPVEFQRSPLSEEDYNNLLVDYRTLCDYPESADFPRGERPTMLVKL